MLQINVDALLEARGVTRYWLSKQMAMEYQNVVKLAEGKTTAIRFETLETLCLVLDCTPNDLFTILNR